jgi:hypothetical protein
MVKGKIHDFKSKTNTYTLDSKNKSPYLMIIKLVYMIIKTKYNAFSGLPNIGFNPDDGVKIGFITSYNQ